MDRTLLILDIFAKHATTSEGKIQVELAQLRYRSRRAWWGFALLLSRLGGGIGTRGPGEKKLETDSRLIRTRIICPESRTFAGRERHRELICVQAEAGGNLKTAAIVGYTNAGKSTPSECTNRIPGTFRQKISFLPHWILPRSVTDPGRRAAAASYRYSGFYPQAAPSIWWRPSKVRWKRQSMQIISFMWQMLPIRRLSCRCMRCMMTLTGAGGRRARRPLHCPE